MMKIWRDSEWCEKNEVGEIDEIFILIEFIYIRVWVLS